MLVKYHRKEQSCTCFLKKNWILVWFIRTSIQVFHKIILFSEEFLTDFFRLYELIVVFFPVAESEDS